MEEKAWELIEKIDAMGGSVNAIEQGFMQDEIAASAYEYQRKIETGEKIIVGVNKFGIGEEAPINIFKVDDSIHENQVKRLNALKAKRSNEAVGNSLQKIKAAANNGNNIMPSVLEAVEAYATLGEIADVLRGVFGEYK